MPRARMSGPACRENAHRRLGDARPSLGQPPERRSYGSRFLGQGNALATTETTAAGQETRLGTATRASTRWRSISSGFVVAHAMC